MRYIILIFLSIYPVGGSQYACLSSPCQNGGQCENLGAAFRCICPNGYLGTRCEIIAGKGTVGDHWCKKLTEVALKLKTEPWGIRLVGLTSHYITQRGKIAENTMYACALLSAHTDTHGTKGKKGTISRMSDQANTILYKAIGGTKCNIYHELIWEPPDDLSNIRYNKVE